MNESSITLGGTVGSSTSDGFDLDHGRGTVRIEMGGWDWYRGERMLASGDRVTVTGPVTRDLITQRRLEPNAIYVGRLDTVFISNDADAQQMALRTIPRLLSGQADVTGRVISIDGRKLRIGSPRGSMVVDTEGMNDNPLDSWGTPKIRTGDRVIAWGRLDTNDNQAAQLRAIGMILLVVDRTKSLRRTPRSGLPDGDDARGASVGHARPAGT